MSEILYGNTDMLPTHSQGYKLTLLFSSHRSWQYLGLTGEVNNASGYFYIISLFSFLSGFETFLNDS